MGPRSRSTMRSCQRAAGKGRCDALGLLQRRLVSATASLLCVTPTRQQIYNANGKRLKKKTHLLCMIGLLKAIKTLVSCHRPKTLYERRLGPCSPEPTSCRSLGTLAPKLQEFKVGRNRPKGLDRLERSSLAPAPWPSRS